MGPGAAADECTVLVIDDDAAVSDATGMMLDACGYVVTMAESGEAAIAGLTNGLVPNLVIADYRLPGANGLEVIREIRRIIGRQIPAIIITGDTSATTVRASGVPGIRFFRKPMNADALISSIDEWRATGRWLE